MTDDVRHIRVAAGRGMAPIRHCRMTAPCIALLDNGSLRPAATRNLRAVATALGKRVGVTVAPVSLLHSHKVPAGDLEGQSAAILEPWLKREAEAGTRDFLLVPFFLGPSRALTDYVPERVAKLKVHWPDLVVRVAPALVREDGAGAEVIAEVLEERVRARLDAGMAAAVAVVDHGSPEPKVTAVRNQVTERVKTRLGSAVRAVAACSMERREGAEYAFGDPLLTTLLDGEPFDRGQVIVAAMFLSPGRHAGPDGDVATICRAAEARHPGLGVAMTDLLGGHPALIELLAERLRDGGMTTPL